jgi:hypothetical protein
MYDPTNPYASPMSTEMNPVAIQWLGTPSPSLLKVARGLGLIYAGICLALLGVIGGAVLMAVVRSLEMFQLVGLVTGICVVVAWILNITGTLFCLATPEESGAQGMIYASAAAMGISLLLKIAEALTAIPPGVRLLAGLAAIVSGITFLVFMKRLATFVGRQDLARRAQSILNWCIGLFVAMVATIAYMTGSVGMAFIRGAATGREAPVGDAAASAGIGFIIMGIIGIAALFTFLRYANLLTYLRKAILSGGQG